MCKIWIFFYSRETERDGHIKQTIIPAIENRTTKRSPRNWGAQKRGGSPSGSSGKILHKRAHLSVLCGVINIYI